MKTFHAVELVTNMPTNEPFNQQASQPIMEHNRNKIKSQ